ncbi:PWWP domain-containing protein 2B-like [Sinocyclocheilus grahami]|uniref:PWWP domain-containing protein 2B-like n=1 Tax=Sinocyclocheilus grahami TaxID=75366 RepID=UPI0007ACC5D6|nr:PREDICTED: PWWP domain-containing protein 2B-like [Sinocyclocheilus grahami]
MQAVAEELRAGSRIPVTVEQIVNDTLVVTLTYRERSYTGILLDCSRKTGLFCLPDVVGKSEESLILRPDCEVSSEEASPKPVSQPTQQPKDENTEPEVAPPLAPVPIPVQPGQPTYPPYFEGAPFPQPMWVRHTYNQWVPQPPPHPIKRKKRRSREPGRMTMSTIRLRPRQVLCEKCKNTLNSDEDSKDGPTVTKTSRKENAPQANEEDTKSTPAKRKDDGDNKESKRREESTVYDTKCFRKDKKDDEKSPKGDIIPHSPVIKISYSTPQGKGEVMKIPSRVHGSVKPFCPKQLLQNGHRERDASKESQKVVKPPVDVIRTGLTISIPKLKLPKLSNPDAPSPKIHLRSRADGAEQVSAYEAELVDGVRRKSPRVPNSQSEDEDEDGSGLAVIQGFAGAPRTW